MRSLYGMLVAGAIALVGLSLYDNRINAETFALDPTVTLSTESWKGVLFTAPGVSEIKTLIAHSAGLQAAEGKCKPLSILWLGNSQLHFINQYAQGDHVAPYWLRQAAPCPDTTVPLGVSLPNANLQEHYILASYVTARLPIRLIILELCFDDMREDGLRGEFSGLLDESDRERLAHSPTGRDIVLHADEEWRHVDVGQRNSGLEGFVQKAVEDRLDHGLARIWPLWADREDLRTDLLTDLYYLRNRVLGIKPTTVRKMIAPRYDRNMKALDQLLHDAQTNNIRVVAYIAPIRQDFPVPYDHGEYESWKSVVADMAKETGATLLNLETLVPPPLWGNYHGDDIDFMHFRGPGHQLLAEALLPYVQLVEQSEL